MTHEKQGSSGVMNAGGNFNNVAPVAPVKEGEE